MAFVTRNISISTMFGDIVSIIRKKDKKVIKTARWRDRGKENYIAHLGGINLTLVNDDPIAFGERTMGLPSMGEIVNRFVPLDSEPKTKPVFKIEKSITLTTANKHEDALMKVLSELNSEVVSSAEAKNGLIDTSGMFLINNGECTFNRSYIKYEYEGETLADAFDLDDNVPMYAKRGSGILVVDNNKLREPANEPPEHEGEWIHIYDDEIIELSKADVFSVERKFGTHTAHVPKFQIYFPFKYYIDKQLKMDYAEKGSSKYVLIENYKYRLHERNKTYSTEFTFDIVYRDYKIKITQIVDWVNLEAE